MLFLSILGILLVMESKEITVPLIQAHSDCESQIMLLYKERDPSAIKLLISDFLLLFSAPDRFF